jgi:hypothetical protein
LAEIDGARVWLCAACYEEAIDRQQGQPMMVHGETMIWMTSLTLLLRDRQAGAGEKSRVTGPRLA